MNKILRRVLNQKKIYLLLEVLGLIMVLGFTIFLIVKPDTSQNGTNNSGKPQDSIPEEPQDITIVDLESKSRPYAVMINNHADARPYQSGLQDAYIVYELIVEGGITRMMALFKDAETARIGSVRSARHYYLDYALENDAIYIHHGQSPQAAGDFSKLGIDRIEVSENRTGWRDTEIRKNGVAYEHTLFTSIEKLNNGLGNKRVETNKELLLNYSAKSVDYSKIEDTIDANSVNIVYSSISKIGYVYNPDTKNYERSFNGKKHIDYVTKEQYTAKNIIVYEVGNYTLNDGENKGRQELENIGTGTGYLITEGIAVPIKWSKNDRKSQTVYMYENGQEIEVNDGNTFIQIMPKSGSLVIE